MIINIEHIRDKIVADIKYLHSFDLTRASDSLKKKLREEIDILENVNYQLNKFLRNKQR